MNCIDCLLKASEVVSKICTARRGIKPSFDYGHVALALLYLLNHEPLGRQLLSKYLGLGEASTRTLIKRLREQGLIDIDRVGGAILTSIGKEVAICLDSCIPLVKDVPPHNIAPWRHVIAVVIRQGVEVVKRIGIVAARDVAIACGAEGATIMFVNDRIYIPDAHGNPCIGLDDSAQALYKEVLCKAEQGDCIVLLGFNTRKSIVEGYTYMLRLMEKVSSTS